MQNNNPPAITEAEEERRGRLLVDVLKLKKDKANSGRYLTNWGNKTPLGIFRTVQRIVLDGE